MTLYALWACIPECAVRADAVRGQGQTYPSRHNRGQPPICYEPVYM